MIRLQHAARRGDRVDLHVANRNSSTRLWPGARLFARVERLESSALDFARLRLPLLASSGIARMSDGEAKQVRLLATGERAPTRSTEMAAVERWRPRIEDPLLDGVTVEMCEHAIRLYEAAFTARGPQQPANCLSAATSTGPLAGDAHCADGVSACESMAACQPTNPAARVRDVVGRAGPLRL